MRHAVLLAIALATLRAQSAPGADTILKRADQALESHPTFQFQWRSVSKGSGREVPFRHEYSGTMSGRSDGRFRIESSAGVTVVNDGKVTWTYQRQFNTWDNSGFLGSFRLHLLAQTGVSDVQWLPSVGEVREEKIEVDGKTRDCWVVTTAAPLDWKDEQSTVWIDKELGIDWKVVTKEHIPRDQFDAEITVEKFNLTFDPVLPDSLFTFTKPPGSKQFCCRDANIVH